MHLQNVLDSRWSITSFIHLAREFFQFFLLEMTWEVPEIVLRVLASIRNQIKPIKEKSINKREEVLPAESSLDRTGSLIYSRLCEKSHRGTLRRLITTHPFRGVCDDGSTEMRWQPWSTNMATLFHQGQLSMSAAVVTSFSAYRPEIYSNNPSNYIVFYLLCI